MALLEASTTALLQRDSPLTTTEAHELLCADDEGASRLPFRPMGSNIFRYYNREGPQDWRADGHWWINQGTTSLPRRNPLIKKRFIRNVYFLPNNKDTGPFIIQYLGDSSTFKVTGHWDRKKDTVNVYARPYMAVMDKLTVTDFMAITSYYSSSIGL